MADTEYAEFVKSLRGGAEDAEYKSFVSSLGSFRAPPAPQPIAATPETPSAWRRVPDVGVAALKGAVGLAETGIGLADIPTMGAVGRGLEKIGVRPREAQEELSTWYSPQQQAAQREVSGAFREGVVPGVVSALRHPSTIATTVGESLPSMVGGAGVSRGIMKLAPSVAPWLAGAVGEGLVGAGQAAEQIRQQSETGYLTPKQLASIAASGAGTAALGVLGGRMAERFGVGDIETAMAKGALREAATIPEKIPKSFFKRAAISGITEGVFEELPQSVQEQMWQNYATDKPLTEGLSEAAGMGMLAGVGMGATAGALTRPRDLIKTKAEPEAAPVAAGVRGTIPDMFTGEMRPPVNEYQAAMDDAMNQVSPGQADMFYSPSEYTTPGGAPLTFGVTSGIGGTRVVRGGRGAKEAGVVTPAKGKKLSPIEEARARVDALFPVDSPEHVDATNMLDTATSKTRGKALAAVNKMISSAQKGEPYAGQIEKPSKGVLRGKGAQPQVEVGLPGAGEVYAQPQEVAGEGKAQKALVAFEASLPKQQQDIFKVLREAASDPTEWEKYVQPDGTWNATAIAEAAGVGSRKGIPTTIARLRKKLDTAAGQDVKAALSESVAAKRVTEPSAYDQLGLSPAQQASVVAPEDLFGGEGMEQSMGEIPSVGGTQGATSADVSGPMTQQERAIEQEARRIVREGEAPAIEAGVPTPTERGLEAVRDQKIADIVDAIQSGDAQDAVFEWNQLVDRVVGLEEIPTNLAEIELTSDNIDAMHAVVSAYQDVRQQVEASVNTGKFFDEIGAYEYEFKRIVRERQARIEKVVGGGRKEARATVAEKPEAGGVAAEAGRETAEPVVGAKGAEGVKVSKRKTRTVAPATGGWKFPEPAAMRSEAKEPKASGNTVSTIVENLRKVFFSPLKMDSVVSVVQTEADLPDTKDMDEFKSARGGTQGFYDRKSGKAWLIANNIPVGQELSVMLHEVGVHMGMRNLLGPENYTKLTNQLIDWYHTGTGKEKEFIDLSVKRVMAAQKAKQDVAVAEAVAEAKAEGIDLPEASIARIRRAAKLSDVTATEELLAYFVEEAVNAGIRPTAMHGLSKGFQQWIKLLWRAISRAVRKLGINPNKLTARDVVNLAYGAAHMELQKGGKPGPVTTKYKDKGAFDKAEKFLATTGAYTTTNVVTQKDGTVWATREPVEKPEKLRSMAATVSPDSPSAGVWQAVGSAFDKFLSDPVHALKVHGLGWLSLSHLAEVAKRINPEVGAYQSVVQRMQTMEKHWVQKAAKIDVEWGNIKDAVQSKKLSDVMREATREGFDPSDPKAVPENAAQRAIKQKYNQLVPAAKAVYADARDHYAQVRKERQDIMESAIEAAYRNRIETAKAEGDTKAQAKFEKKLAEEMEKVGTMYASVKGPYFPLMRLGEWYAVGMSKELAALMDKDKKTEADEKRIAELRKDPKHYRTKSFDRQSQAKAEVKKMEQEFDVARYNVASERNKATSVLSAAGLKDVESYIADTFDAKVAGEIKDMMNELYYMSLPENSVLKRELRREGVHGEEEDMRRVFAVTSLRNAHYLSRMKHADAIKGSLHDAMMTGKKNGSDAMEMYNEIAKRAKLTMDETSTPIVDLLTTGSYLAHLGMSPAFILTNATQVPMITIPWLAARSSLGTATSAVSKAYKKTFDIIKSSYSDQGWRAEMDWSGKVSSNEGKMLTELLERNLLNITMEHDLGVVASGKRYMVGGKDVSVGDAMKIGNLPVHITEIANRVTTALAAYNVAVSEKKMSHEEAMEFAAKAVSDTQLDYSALNAPRHMQRVLGSAALAKLTMQFRRYQQGMLWLIAKNVFDAMISKNATAQEKQEAKRTLLGLFTTTGVMAGSLGLPMAGTVAFIASMIAKAAGDEDEPWDAETEYRNWLTELMGKDAAEAVAKGLPAWMFNVDLSKRVGLGDVASPLPFMRQGKTTKETAANALLAMAGAPVSTTVDVIDGLSMMNDGEWAKGAEKVIPLKLAQNIVKAGRYQNEGMTKPNGEVILPPDKFSLADIGVLGLGLPTATESRYYEATKAIESKKAAAKDVRSKLLGRYAQAKMAGEDTADVMEKIKSFNERHPERGVRIDASSRVKSVQARRRAARERGESGVSMSKANKPYLSEAEFAT